MSKVLARLEAEAGLKLFERTARGVALTEAGFALRAHAVKIGAAVDDLERDLRGKRLARTGSVRLGALPIVVSSVISPLLARFFDSRPLATFSIEAHLSAQLFALLRGAKVDLIVAAIPDTPPADLESAALGALAMQIVARADHPRLHTFERLADLAGERWAVPAPGLYLREWLHKRFVDAGLPPPRLAVESNASPVAFAELLRSSELLSIMPPRVLALPAGQGLVAVEVAGGHWEHRLGLFWRREAPLSPMARDFADALVAYCSETGLRV